MPSPKRRKTFFLFPVFLLGMLASWRFDILPCAAQRFPVLGKRPDIAPPNIKNLALPNGNIAVQRGKNAQLSFDWNGDGRAELLRLTFSPASKLSIRLGRKTVSRTLARDWNIWKITTADVDGDGKRDIVMGVNKRTRSLPFLHNCLFIMGFDGAEIFPKWLGSSLARPFDDFLCGDVDGDKRDEIIALETTPHNTRSLGVYSWDSFGLALDAQHGNWKDARLVRLSGSRVLMRSGDKTLFQELR